MLCSKNPTRRLAALLAAAACCLFATASSAQLRGLPSVGGAGIGGTGLGGSGLGGLGGGIGGTGLGDSGSASPGLTLPLPGPAAGAVNSAQGAVSSTLDRTPPLNSVTNSLTGGVTRAVSRTTNSLVNPGGPLGQGGTIARSTPNAATAVRSGVPPVGERRYVAREVVAGLASDLSPAARDALARRHRLTLVDSHEIALVGTTYHRWRIDDGRSVSDVIRALEADGVVRTAQPNYRFTLAESAPPSDGTVAAVQYAPAKLHVAEAHRFATGERVAVAVIDSGIDTSHPEIMDAVADRFDAIAPAGTLDPHGTGMAGAIVSRARLAGIAPGVRLLAIRAFNGQGAKSEATTMSILTGIDWATAHGARVINMSFAGPYDPDIARGLAAARQKGVVLVAAAGNAGPKSPPLYPAADKNVIAVTATDAGNRLLSAANHGRYISVAAPGVDVLVPAPGGAYQLTTGTSVAAAEVSGIAALMVQVRPDITPDEVQKVLQATAEDLGPKGFDDQYGAGLADAARAVMALEPAASAERPLLFADRWPDVPLLSPSQQ